MRHRSRDGGRLESGEHSLISAATTAAVDSAFNSLAQTVPVQNGRTLEDLVREMLRPMLKTWLDDNLPGVVERLVRAEIERVSSGNRGERQNALSGDASRRALCSDYSYTLFPFVFAPSSVIRHPFSVFSFRASPRTTTPAAAERPPSPGTAAAP